MSENFIQVKMPSHCKAYPPEVDPEKISMRVTKGRDEKIISEITNDNFEKKFLMLLKSVMQGIDPNILTLGDRKYAMIWLVINSISPKQTLDMTCQTCLQQIKIDVDLSTFEVKELPEELVLPKAIKLSDRTVTLRLLTVGDEVKVASLENQGQNVWLYRYALSVVPQDEKKTVWNVVEELEDMNASDLAKIRAFHEVYDHGPIMETKYECQKCGGVGQVAVPFRIEMLFPYGETLKATFGAEL